MTWRARCQSGFWWSSRSSVVQWEERGSLEVCETHAASILVALNEFFTYDLVGYSRCIFHIILTVSSILADCYFSTSRPIPFALFPAPTVHEKKKLKAMDMEPCHTGRKCFFWFRCKFSSPKGSMGLEYLPSFNYHFCIIKNNQM